MGAVASITVAAPLDVVKTRIQNANFNTNVSGVAVIKEMLKTEGPSSFFKGLTPKVSVERINEVWTSGGNKFQCAAEISLRSRRRSTWILCSVDAPRLYNTANTQILVVGPKLVFSYTLAQSLIPFFGKYV